jgi:hypothetical protein
LFLDGVEFHWEVGPVPGTAPAADVPPGFENRNVDLNKIMSLHWVKGRNVAEATASRWLLRSMDWFWDPGLGRRSAFAFSAPKAAGR